MLKGVGYTLLFALSSMVGGLVLGFVLAVARISRWRLIQWPAAVYVSLMRGTPLLVQIFVVYYGLPSVGIEFSPLMAGVLTLSLNASAISPKACAVRLPASAKANGGPATAWA